MIVRILPFLVSLTEKGDSRLVCSSDCIFGVKLCFFNESLQIQPPAGGTPSGVRGKVIRHTQKKLNMSYILENLRFL